MDIPALDVIDPSCYPMSVADWRESSNYSNHGEDAPSWAWEFVRRRRDFQLLTDIRDATHLAQSNGLALIDNEPGSNEKIAQMYRRQSEIRKLRLSDLVVDELRQYSEFNEELTNAKERRELLSRDHEYKLGFGHVVARYALERLFPQFKQPTGWRSATPWFEIPGMDKPKTANPEIHRHEMPPWPVKWYGDDLIPENDWRMSIELIDATSIEAYTPKQSAYVDIDEETGRFKLPDDNDEVLRVLYGQAVGSVIDFGKRAEYRNIVNSDEHKEACMAHIAFDLSAPMDTQLKWAEKHLTAMRERAIAVGVLVPEGKAEGLPGHHGVNRLRYLDYESDSEKCSPAEFQRMLGWAGGDSTQWRRLRESALKYRDEIGSKLCDYRKPLRKKST